MIRQDARDELFRAREIGVSITVHMGAGRIPPGQKRGSARRANWALDIGLAKCRAIADQPIQRRGPDMRIPQRSDCVKALLIGAIPQNIGSV